MTAIHVHLPALLRKPVRDRKAKDAEQFKPGEKVHVGLRNPGGAGYQGRVVRVDGEWIYIKNDEGTTYKGLVRNTTKDESPETKERHEGKLSETIEKQISYAGSRRFRTRLTMSIITHSSATATNSSRS